MDGNNRRMGKFGDFRATIYFYQYCHFIRSFFPGSFFIIYECKQNLFKQSEQALELNSLKSAIFFLKGMIFFLFQTRPQNPTFNITSVWPAYTGKGILVAVVDNGVDGNHPELSSNYVMISIFYLNCSKGMSQCTRFLFYTRKSFV